MIGLEAEEELPPSVFPFPEQCLSSRPGALVEEQSAFHTHPLPAPVGAVDPD